MRDFLSEIFKSFTQKNQQTTHKRNYTAGKRDRLHNWNPAIRQTAEQTDRPYRELVKSRARDLERNSDITQAILSAFVRNVIGKGIHPQPKMQTVKISKN